MVGIRNKNYVYILRGNILRRNITLLKIAMTFLITTLSQKPFFPTLRHPITAFFTFTRKTDIKQRLDSAQNLSRMARDVESFQPNLAAELRYFASR
jgi:hypothetical protein